VQKGRESHRVQRRDGGALANGRKKRDAQTLPAGEQHITLALEGKIAKRKASYEISEFLHEAEFVCQDCGRICETVNHKLDCLATANAAPSQHWDC